MSLTFSEQEKQLLTREAKAMAFLALTLFDGSPHVSPIWFDWDGTHIILNTARGHLEDNVSKKHPRTFLKNMRSSRGFWG